MSTLRTLITGADGYVGTRLVETCLREDIDVLAWVHARSAEELRGKRQSLVDRLLSAGIARERLDSLSFAAGALHDELPFELVDPESVSVFIHSAAVTRFNVDADTARMTNFEGTQKALRFARRCKHLKRFVLISTIYSSGLQSGVTPERPFDAEREFANHYEQSKWASENELVTNFGDLPWQIARVSTIIADDDSGCVTQQNAFHNTLKLFYYGLLSVMPGVADVPLYLVHGGFVSRSILQAAQQGAAHSVYHVAHRKDESANLGELIDNAFAIFEEDASFRRRRVLKPLYADIDSFSVLADTMATLGQGVMSQALLSVSPFARQLFISKDVRNDNMRALLPDYHAPDAVGLIRSTCRYLVETKWGRVADAAKC